MTEHLETDFLIIGSGVAGLFTAIRAAEHGSVVLVTKAGLLDSNTWYAQGGIAAAISQDDSPQAHLQDTLQAGAGLCVEDAVAILVNEGPQRIFDLISLGTRFDRSASGELALGKEAAHSCRRIVHARGDATGAEVAESLADCAKRTSRLSILEECVALDLLIANGRCLGAVLLSATGESIRCLARGTVLATGGCGQLFDYTTNPAVATGDGYALAARAGAHLVDMEFVQFHPTALATDESPMPLISEAVRGEGARLVDPQGQRFMHAIHPLGELAPRDVVARAIFTQMQRGHSVYLDATHMGQHFATRFPTIFQICRERGIDPRQEPMPVAPAAHFMMGGIDTNTQGATAVPGLFACGEVACTGVHGANRLASNSLLEGLVFAERVARALKDMPIPTPQERSMAQPAGPMMHPPATTSVRKVQDLIHQLQQLMWNAAGIMRTGESLSKAQEELRSLSTSQAASVYPAGNMLQVAWAIVTAALQRWESRGGHYRKDFPASNSTWAKRRIRVSLSGLDIISLS